MKFQLLISLLLISLIGNGWQFSKIKRIQKAAILAEAKFAELSDQTNQIQSVVNEISAKFKEQNLWLEKAKQRENEMVQASNSVIGILRSDNDSLRSELAKKSGQNDQSSDILISEAHTPKPAQWVSVISFTGHGEQRTSPFEITGDAWRIHWHMKATDVALFSFLNIMSEGTHDDLLVNTDKPSDETTYGQGKGSFDLKITALNCDWDISIEQEL